MKKNLNLSKSTVIRSLQCQKSLYLYKNFYRLRDPISPEQKAVFDRGHAFGHTAQELFPGGKDVSPASPRQFKQSLLATEALVDQHFPVIYEAAFRFNNVLVYLDILELRDGDWYAHEVKSSRRISNTYIQDAAIQYHVIQSAGLPLKDFRIIHVREDYDPEVHLDAQSIFVSASVLEEVKQLSGFVEESIERATATLMLDDVPDIPTGDHCDHPYPCDFKGVCWKQAGRTPG